MDIDGYYIENFLTEVLNRRNEFGCTLDEAIQSAALRKGVDWFRMIDPLYDVDTDPPQAHRPRMGHDTPDFRYPEDDPEAEMSLARAFVNGEVLHFDTIDGYPI